MWGVAIGLGYAWCAHRDLRRILLFPSIAFFVLLVDSFPATAWLSTSLLAIEEIQGDPTPQNFAAIIVLGGSTLSHSSAPTLPLPGPSSYLRAVRAAALYHQLGHGPVIVSGGPPFGQSQSPAVTMANVLKVSGVPESEILVENQSRNTRENAKKTALLLQQNRLRGSVALVTSVNHARRASLLFQKAGVQVTVVEADDPRHEMEPGLWLFWPKATALQINQSNLHELGGLLVDWWQGNL